MSKKFYLTNKSIGTRLKKIYKRGGIYYIISAIFNVIFYVYLKNYFWHYYFQIFRKFKFQGNLYSYFYHPYNRTWCDERIIEIPIIWRIIKGRKGMKILEVGNVLSHYFSINHEVVDKYEKAKGVKNIDIINFRTEQKYDLIVSISTLEHIGWDEKPKKPAKIFQAIKNLKNILVEDGQIIATIPLGQNSFLDSILKTKKTFFNQQYYFKRISFNKWIEANREDIKYVRYNQPYPAANGLMIGIIKK